MMQNIQILATETRAFALDNNDFYEPTADAVASYCQYAVKLIEILKDSIPGLSSATANRILSKLTEESKLQKVRIGRSWGYVGFNQ